jgi:hypothetical protein
VDYSTASFRELIEELVKTKAYLTAAIKELDSIFQRTKNKVKDNPEVLQYLQNSYESDIFGYVISDSKDIIKIIDNIMSDLTLREYYVSQLKEKAELGSRERAKKIGDFKEEWAGNPQDFSDLYVHARDMDKWIQDCSNIGFGLIGFIGERNPLYAVKEKKIETISTEPKIKEAGKLNLRESGNICYENKILKMPIHIKTLCELFMDRPNQLVNRDDIRDELAIDSSEIKDTVSKYVSALNRILKPYFGQKPIKNHKKSGWILTP